MGAVVPRVEPKMIEPWPEISRRTLLTTPVFTLGERLRCHPTSGAAHPFYVLETGSWVNIIPITEAGEVVFVRQYRHGTGQVHLEIPGGLVDAGEEPEKAAVRELLEETGYAGEVAYLGEVHSNPAILNNTTYSYVVRNARRVAVPELDATEEIEVVTHPLTAVPDLIRTRVITHALVICAFHHLGLLAG
ncbi:MAG: NUDIX hydrolase [Nitrospirae bacterium CG_4_8_14_3_um_filter_70_85]|nr:MAG: NUDIX hydrolase [Nitrospirae bacterium CG06_land_8_20_14_3_00_70_43]PIW82597.1 MAG: NUDIX hydrolase [Nitrospirae bacterium CG_4_8_14_3_um_filter_70_85]PIX83314.1 MAG: NUDIX hydrolase [Nitrospirae bacterium CG_4_10_14_3_um_filter_70_108]PJB95549.1 MAG: NUDIX hydrolase [Nitrospirae bacterium CG_4_9_14_0_8_um_filter_70_14]HBB40411.1 NUDIX hydrolase [Pseudomonadota bacterium]